ncbi:MAG: energy transducer TonB [Thiobacillaceae bacterium]
MPEPEPSVIPHLELPQLADTTYYDALALDVQPQAIGTVELVDPEAGSPSPHVGHVRLQLKLEADGRVSEAKVLESSLPPVYEALALDEFGKAKFTPGRRNGRAVRARIVIVVNFKPPELNSR